MAADTTGFEERFHVAIVGKLRLGTELQLDVGCQRNSRLARYTQGVIRTEGQILRRLKNKLVAHRIKGQRYRWRQ